MKEIKKYLESRLGEYGFYFEDLDCGYVYGFNENLVTDAGACIHIPLALALLKEVEQGNVKLNETIFISEECIEENTILSYLKPKECTIKELLIFMLIQNDTTAYEILMGLLGVDKFNKYMKDIGLTNTKIIDGELKAETCAYDLSKCWNIINKAEYICKENRDFIVNTLKVQPSKNKIACYYSKEDRANISCKGGSINKGENDSCYLNHPKGKFSFTILSKNIPSDVYGVVTLAKAGKIAIDIIENSWK